MQVGKTTFGAVSLAAAMTVVAGSASATEILSIAEILDIVIVDDVDTAITPDITLSTSVDLTSSFDASSTTGDIDPVTGEAAPVAEVLSDSYSNGIASLAGTSDGIGPLASAELVSVGGMPLGGIATALSVTEQLFTNFGDDGFIDIEIAYALEQIFDATDGTESAIGEIEVTISVFGTGAFAADSVLLSGDPLGGDIADIGSLLFTGLEVFAGDEVSVLTSVFAEVSAADPGVIIQVFEPATGVMIGLGLSALLLHRRRPRRI